MPTPTFRIAEAVTPDDRATAFKLRYQVFVRELGYRVPGADPDRGLVDPEDEHAFVMLGYADDVPVATAAVDLWGRSELSASKIANYRLQEFADVWGRESVVVFRKGLVAQQYRKSPLFAGLVRGAIERLCRDPRGRFAFIESSPYLVTMYERMGARRYAPHFTYDDTGAIAVPLCVVIEDHDYFARIGAPVLELIKAHGRRQDPDVQRFMLERWGHPAIPAGVAASPADVLDPHDAVNQTLAFEAIPLFESVERPHVEQFLAACRTVRFKPRDVMIQSASADTDLYLLTRGYVEVTRDAGGRAIAVATRGPGDLIGEMAMLLGTGRTTAVTALTDVEAVLIPERVFREGLRDSTVVARINLNLARIIARRLRIADGLITQPPPL